VSYRLVRALFLRGLALVYLAAFASLLVQVEGLAGTEGIVPADLRLDIWASELDSGFAAVTSHPTLFWWIQGPPPLTLFSVLGVVGAVVLSLAPLAPRRARTYVEHGALASLWVLYLSLSSVILPFLAFQWDALLLEVGFIAIFFTKRAPAIPIWLLRWTLFRLYFLSGVVKLASGDVTWRRLEAMDVHYWTQPLPSWTSVWAHHLPHWFHAMEVLGTFAVELILPFLIFGPRRARLAVLPAMIGLQIVIGLTGNYGYFGLLNVVLCLSLLDDRAVRWSKDRLPLGRMGARTLRRPQGRHSVRSTGSRVHIALLTPFVLFASVVGLVHVHRAFVAFRNLPEVEQRIVQVVQPFRITNGYGLFATMTTDRVELRIQGSDDGVEWWDYVFEWKPGELAERPRFQQPHMPRLDWQMWFAPLYAPDNPRNEWIYLFVERLLLGSDSVADLLRENPFASGPPRLIRVVRERYRFSSHEQRRAPGRWWQRETLGLWCPVLTLDGDRVVAYRPAP